MREIGEIMRTSPAIPVLVIHDVAQARPIGEALIRGGLRVLEVTLRTPAALDVIKEMRGIDGAVVGAGTVLTEAQLDDSLLAGAEFAVSPGLTEPLAKAAIARAIPYLPGAAWFGFVPLSMPVMGGLIAITVAYLVASEAAKRWFFSRERTHRRS